MCLRDPRRARRRLPVMLLAAATLLAAPLVCAQEAAWPSRPVRVTVCFPPGASTDAVARRIGERLAGSLGQPVVIENRGGAGGNIAAAQIARSAPDGHNLLFCATAGLIIAAAANAPLEFDPQHDLVSVVPVGMLAVLMIARPSLPAQTLQEFIAYAKANPGRVNFASIGVGSSFHLALEQVNAAAGISMTHIPFRGGGQAVPELLAGRIDAMFASWSLAKPHVQAGTVRPLAVAGEERYAELPQLPTMAEAGLPGIWLQEGLAFFAPHGTPQAIVSRLNAEVSRIIMEPSMRAWLTSQGVPPSPMEPDSLCAELHRSTAIVTDLIRKLALRLH